jgi:hypothetical protein
MIVQTQLGTIYTRDSSIDTCLLIGKSTQPVLAIT